MNSDEIKADIQLRARELGFTGLRVAPIDLAPRYEQAFADWLAAGRHGSMSYLARRHEAGRGPTHQVPEARRLIVLATNYHQPELATASAAQGRISVYAIGRDYHKTIGGRLKELSGYLARRWSAAARWYVDTGPVLERAFAETAGLGYIGRNTCLITEDHGSWVFLAVIVTDLALPLDAAGVRLRCGSCRRCLTACPTGCIRDDYTLDARRCISYLTIENRGPIPVDLRPAVGNWLFGCDICQEVCPHNGRAVPTRVTDFREVRVPGGVMRLEEILRLETDAAFLAVFAGSPLMRAKRRGLMRNACVVAGNSGDSSLRPALQAIIAREPDTMLQEHADWALRRLEAEKSE